MGGPGASVLLRASLTKQQENELEVWLRSITHNLEKNKWGYEFWLNEDAFPGTVSRCLFYLSLEKADEDRRDKDVNQQIKTFLGYLPEQSIGVSSGCNQDDDHATLSWFMLHLANVYDGLIDMGGAITPPLRPLNQAEQAKIKGLLTSDPKVAKERRTYTQERFQALIKALPPGKTQHDLWKEQHSDPHSPLKALFAEVEAKFGPAVPPEFSIGARDPSLEEINAYVSAMPGKAYGIEYTTVNDRRWIFHIVDREFLLNWMEHPNFRMIK